MKSVRYLLIVFFLAVIFLPVTGEIAGLNASDKLEENRYLNKHGETTVRKLYSYLRNFDSQFWGRDILVKWYIGLKKDLFKTTPLPEKLVIGKSGWLYLADYGTIDDYRNLKPFSQQEIDSVYNYLYRVNSTLAKRNMKLYVVVVPDKHTVYPEYLPDNLQKVNPVSRLQQLTDKMKLQPDIRFINLADTLITSKGEGLLYLKEESHWNDLGTFIAYRKILNTCKADFPDIKILSLDSCRIYQGQEKDLDLAKLLGEDTEYSEPSLKIEPNNAAKVKEADAGVVIPAAKRFNSRYAFRRVNPTATNLKAIIYRDSFFSSLTPFFEQSFAETTYVWTNDVDLEYVLDQDAQAVFIEIAERHIDLLKR